MKMKHSKVTKILTVAHFEVNENIIPDKLNFRLTSEYSHLLYSKEKKLK